MSTTPSEEPVLPVAPGTHRTHPCTVMLGIAGIVFGALLGFVLEGIGIELIISFFGLREVLSWFLRTYEVRPDELLITEGILTRHRRVVPYRRVQQVDVRRGLLAQVLGLASFRVDTAGSQEGRVDLSLLDRATAEELRSFVLARRASSQDRDLTPDAGAPTMETSVGSRPLFSIDGGRLLLGGATNDLGVIVGVVAILFLLVGIPIEVAVDAHSAIVIVTLALALMIPVVCVVGGAIGAVLTYARYTLTVRGNDLQVDHGLLQIQHVTVPRRRVQLVSVTDNPVRRLLGVAALDVYSAAPEGGRDDAIGRLHVPCVERQRVPALLIALMDDASWQIPSLQPRPRAARRRGVVRRSLALALPATVATVVAFPFGAVALVAVVLAVPWGLTAHQRAGHGVTDEMTTLASGALQHRVELVPHRRVQSARRSRSWFQRRTELATLSLDVAGRGPRPRLYDMDATVARELCETIPRLHAPAPLPSGS